MPKPELLAPAGDLECCETAIRFGADAVYIGGPFMQMRAAVTGFTEDQIEKAAALVHTAGKKLYVTVNCFAKNDEIKKIKEYAKRLYQTGVDAVIVSDIGAIAAIRESVPELPIHLSTQANCQNYRTAQVYHAMGVKRIVLAREMSLEEIAQLHANTPPELEIEAFVHGAMCMAYSGRCFISSFLTGRSGNRGECTQPCRWSYHLVEMQRPGEFFPVEETEHGTNILSSRDLNCLSFIDQIAQAGVCSFKIEGRMKSPYYVATVVNAYRRKLDGYADQAALERELECMSHRPYSSGFYFGEMNRYKPDEQLPYTRECTFAGVVKAYDGGIATVEQRGKFSIGDHMEILSPRSIGLSFVVEKITSSSGEETTSACHAQEIVQIPCPYAVQPGDIFRVRQI